MTLLSNPYILGYHGCSREVGEEILNSDRLHLRHSENSYDWLGSGIYFWEADPVRGYDWAVQNHGEDKAFVIGAVIHLGRCLDMMSQSSLKLVNRAYLSFVRHRDRESPGKPLPENKDTAKGPAYYLDCAVINHLHMTLAMNEPDPLPPFNTVRGLYQEGTPVFSGSRIMAKTHVQICVRTPEQSIHGYFRVPEPHYLGRP